MAQAPSRLTSILGHLIPSSSNAAADDTIAVFQQRDHRDFHMDVDTLMDAVILKCAN